MTVSTTVSSVSYLANGTQTTFAYTFKIFEDSDLVVILRDAQGVETTQTLTTDYTVTNAGNDTGGNVVFGTAPASGNTVFIRRVLPITQTTDYVENDPFPAESHEDALDKLTMLIQQTGVDSDLAIRFPDTDSGAGLNNILPTVANRQSQLLSFASDGSVQVTDPASLAQSIIGANYVIDNFTGTGSQTIFTLSAAPGSTNNTSVYIDGVYQEKANYSVASSTLTFTTAPPLNSAVEVVTGDAIPAGSATTAAAVSYTASGTGAQTTNVQAKLREFVSVKDFGAVGDNSSDDTAAIQAAIDAAESATYGGVVYFPPGKYKITSALTVTSNKVSIKGSGAESSVISALSCNGINFTSASYDRGTSFVEDIGLEGRTGSTADHAAIQSILPPGGVSGTDSRDGLHFHRVKLFNFNQGFIIAHTLEWSIRACKFQKVTNPISLGDYAMVGRIIDNYMVYESGDDFSGTAVAYGINFSGAVHEGIIIRGNQIYGFDRCISIPVAVYCSITENDFDGTVYGIVISAANGGCNIENNYFAITTANAIGIFGSAQSVEIASLINVRGNHFEATVAATSSVGIQLNGPANQYQWHWRIKDNNFVGLASYDILSYNSGDLLVEGNRCQSTGTTHSISITDVDSSTPVYIRNNICENTINVTASDVANGDVILTDNYANGAKDYGNAFQDQLALVDGITAPGTLAGYAQIYVDTADGDLKVKFGDGTVKTIVTDT